MEKEIKFKVTNKTSQLIEGCCSCSEGIDEYEVIEALKAFLRKRGIDLQGRDVSTFRVDGCAMCDDCQTEGDWLVM